MQADSRGVPGDPWTWGNSRGSRAVQQQTETLSGNQFYEPSGGQGRSAGMQEVNPAMELWDLQIFQFNHEQKQSGRVLSDRCGNCMSFTAHTPTRATLGTLLTSGAKPPGKCGQQYTVHVINQGRTHFQLTTLHWSHRWKIMPTWHLTGSIQTKPRLPWNSQHVLQERGRKKSIQGGFSHHCALV